MPLNIKFQTGPFIHTYVGRKARRSLKDFLDMIGQERLLWAIANDRQLVSFFPPEQVNSVAIQYPIPKEYLKEFPEEEIYGWIPPEYKAFFESHTNGKKWAMSQIDFLRNLIITT